MLRNSKPKQIQYPTNYITFLHSHLRSNLSFASDFGNFNVK